MIDIIRKYWIEWGLGVIASALLLLYRRLWRRVRNDHIESAALKNGIRALLRDRIVQAYFYYMAAGHWPIGAREAVMGMYDQYRALGGNGVVSDMLEELRELPCELSPSQRNDKQGGT